ncbi:uncharacterized protein [Palaemon carinicauda]|uniref:uncharacterized protein n=1 Tax=Palaemon carinicauda TaxID=392227 RepID=UPI0035B5EE6C
MQMNVQVPFALLSVFALVGVMNGTILLTTGTTAVISGANLLGAAAVAGALTLGAVALKTAAGRGKRDAASCLPLGSAGLYFTMAANGDILDCGRRFVCELEATDEDKLAEEEVLIRNIFSRTTTAFNRTAAGFFAEAGALGTSQGIEACASTFKTCPFDRKTIFLAFKQTQRA